jgi:DNA-binding XRE family transcriptional regulator
MQEGMVATLQAHRINRLWSQAELAQRAGVSRRTIVNIETGKRPPRLVTMRQIADALDIDWTEVDEFRQVVKDLEEKVAA